jgi:hypothetical protein
VSAGTLPALYYNYASQGTFTGSVTSQFGYVVESNLTGATNDYGFYGNLAAATGVWNLYMAGSANNYLAGSLGIGTTSLSDKNFAVQKSMTGAVGFYNIGSFSTINSDVTTLAVLFHAQPATQAAAFTLPTLRYFYATQSTFGATSAVTNQYAFSTESNITGATNNYGFYGNTASGTGRYNLYMAGTADNFLQGSLGIGSTTLTNRDIRINRALTGSTAAYSIYTSSVLQSDVTGSSYGIVSQIGTAAASFTATQITQISATQGTFGAGSVVTNQIGFDVNSNLTGATNNFAIQGNIASGTGRFNLYMAGSAQNYLAGSLGINTFASASALLDVQSTTQGVRMPNMTTTQKNAIASPAAGLMVFDTTLAKLCVYSGAAWQTITSI